MDPHNLSVLKVQRVLGGKTKEYSIQEDVENVMQRECEIRFSLAHSAPIMSTLLDDWLRYLGDTDLRDHKCNRPNVVGKDEDYCCRRCVNIL